MKNVTTGTGLFHFVQPLTSTTACNALLSFHLQAPL
ncbi:MAG: hypothetical protein RL254_1422 [Planctomycetota bacterium]|jgi:hypothetical protein